MNRLGNIGERTTSDLGRTPAFTGARGGGYGDRVDVEAAIGGLDQGVVGQWLGDAVRHVLSRLRNRVTVEMPDYRRVELRERFGIDCIAVTAQSSHTGGSLMSQRECAGFNWPPLSIPAEQPVSSVPSEHRRAGPAVVSQLAMAAAVGREYPPLFGRSIIAKSGPADASAARDVGQPAVAAKSCNRCWFLEPSSRFITTRRADLSLLHDVVGQPATPTSIDNSMLFPMTLRRWIAGSSHLPRSRLSAAIGVTQPESAISDMRPAEARSRKRDKPEGVTHGFQVSLYKIEPYASAAARNLLSSDDWRLALLDEVVESGPQMPLVSKPFSLACRAERLARARSRPDRTIIGPTGAAQGVAVDADAGEEVALSKSSKLIWADIFDAPFVNDVGRDVAASDEFAQPCGGERVDFVVVGATASTRVVERVHGLRALPRNEASGDEIGRQLRTSATMVWMVARTRLSQPPRSYRVIETLISANGDLLATSGYLRAPFATFDAPIHTGATALVCATKTHISGVFGPRYYSQICNSVVGAVAVHMVDFADRPRAILKRKRNAVGEIRAPENAAIEISVVILGSEGGLACPLCVPRIENSIGLKIMPGPVKPFEASCRGIVIYQFAESLNPGDRVAQILQELGGLLLDGIVVEYDAHLPNPRSQSPATRATGGEISRRMTLAVDRSAPATDHAGRGSDGLRGVYVGEAGAHTTPAFAVMRPARSGEPAPR
ncbi:hypothetical protein sphantq_02962 [Sphingobium sp. AntQ-1]|nr:hypothetical protein [Sphingobium sp. AntQ-1]WCP14516.1 hypothetical protein sphantq_02962 [Sphingobium sp. AntQ-1]